MICGEWFNVISYQLLLYSGLGKFVKFEWNGNVLHGKSDTFCKRFIDSIQTIIQLIIEHLTPFRNYINPTPYHPLQLIYWMNAHKPIDDIAISPQQDLFALACRTHILMLLPWFIGWDGKKINSAAVLCHRKC